MRNGILRAVNNKFINIVIFYLLINELSKEDFSLLYFCVFGCLGVWLYCLGLRSNFSCPRVGLST